MCGRYTLVETRDLSGRFGVAHESLELAPRYNVAPGSMMPVIISKERLTIDVMKWGLVPFWAKDPAIGYRMINARAESVTSKPSFKHPFSRQRCLVPASGFYEWQKSAKQPYYFKMKDDGLLAFAGLYDTWKDAEGKELKSFTIVTTEANEVVAPIHNRMPVILERSTEQAWLSDRTPLPEVVALLKPLPQDLMTAFPVDKAVNVARVESEALIRPLNFR